jgi:hypothetical protein
MSDSVLNCGRGFAFKLRSPNDGSRCGINKPCGDMDAITLAADGTFHSFVGAENVGNVPGTI